MTRNGPVALAFHGLVLAFLLAPLVVVVLVSTHGLTSFAAYGGNGCMPPA